MKLRVTGLWVAAVLLTGTGVATGLSAAEPSPSLPAFQEVFDQLQKNLPGVSKAELDRAALEGLVEKLRGRVQVPGLNAATATNVAAIARSRVFDGQLGYIRVGVVGPELPERLADTVRTMGGKTPVRGLVLDLRYASGGDYAAAAATVDRFLSVEQPLLQWPGGEARSTAKTNAIGIPVAALVNGDTREAAEALAGLFRDRRIGLILGSDTAGRARGFKELKLSGGQSILVADQPVKLGSGHSMDDPLAPDIVVAAPKELEAQWLEDPYRRLGPAGFARVRHRVNEAELVRLQREGAPVDEDGDPTSSTPPPAARPAEAPDKPLVQDPALARALDVLRALQIVKPGR